MANEKRWTYAELTTAAEREIEFFREMASKVEEKPAAVALHQAYAVGVWGLWDSLTQGWQAQEDQHRLRSLVEAIGQRPNGTPQ